MPHHRIGGHWNGTDTTFSINLPTKEQWQGRFFQLTYPLQGPDPKDTELGFALDSGGMAVHVKGQAGYRHDAATAKFAKEVAREYYDDSEQRIYGYLYGGSGGSFLTVGAVENTQGVWDGAVPIVQAVPASSPNTPSARALAGFVLADKAAQIGDAVRPGGSKDPFANLTALEEEILREVTTMGIPISTFEDFPSISHLEILLVMLPTVKIFDPSYADDYWSKPGYVGTEQSELGDLIRAAKIDYNATIETIERDESNLPVLVTLDTTVPSDQRTDGLEFTLLKNGSYIGSVSGTLLESGNTIQLDDRNSANTLEALEEASHIRVDNKWFLAMHTFHRHQVPARAGFYGFDQFRDSSGAPLYVQRPVDVSQAVSRSTGGGLSHTGKINMKVIVVDNLMDNEAFPWHADWYKTQVKKALGDSFDDNYRLWFNDHGDHYMGLIEPHKNWWLIDFTGIYEQALRDVSAWAENGTAPPDSSRYKVKDSQVLLRAKASERGGVQPVVTLRGGQGQERVDVTAGERVSLLARIDTIPGSGEVVSVEWDWRGTGRYVEVNFEPSESTIKVRGTFRYCRPGTYIPNVRVTVQRDGDADTPYARVRNLGRARIVVS